MTCIVGLAIDGSVYMGADSAGTSGWSLSVRADRKLFRNGPFLMGFTSSFRMGQLLQYSLSPPTRNDSQDVFSYMVTDFVAAVRTCLKDGGFAKKANEAEEGGEFLVGYAGRLFHIAPDYHVGEEVSGCLACGCGYELALGALHATEGLLAPSSRIQKALLAAERCSAGVRGPFHYEVL